MNHVHFYMFYGFHAGKQYTIIYHGIPKKGSLWDGCDCESNLQPYLHRGFELRRGHFCCLKTPESRTPKESVRRSLQALKKHVYSNKRTELANDYPNQTEAIKVLYNR